MMTANEMISESQLNVIPDKHHPTQKLTVKYMRCGRAQCNINLQSIKAIKRHNVLCHPNKSIATTMMHHVCGSTIKGVTCALSFNTAAQLRKHRKLMDHAGLGRGRSAITQLLKAGLEPVRAAERDWKTKKENKDIAREKKQETRKKGNLPVKSNSTSRSKAQQPIVKPVTITEEQIDFDEESSDSYFEGYNISLSKLQKLSEKINCDSEDTSSSSDEAKTESD